jgi:hypothetical protein
MAKMWGKLAANGPKKEEEEEIEIPFDLNKLFNMAYGFEPLKEVLTDIYKRLHGNGKDVNALDMKLTAKFLEIS